MQQITSPIEKAGTPAKRQWQKPELHILDNDNVNAPGTNGKTVAAFHENTGGGHAASYFS